MNANAEIKTAESFTETFTTNAEFNTHEENKLFKHIQTPKRASNMTQYLSKYLKQINELSGCEINIDEKDYNDNYKYDKEFKTEYKTNKAIFNLINDMYYGINDFDEKRKLRKKFNYLINERQIRHPFFYIEESRDKTTFYSINYLFQFIKRTLKGKNGDKLFNKVKEFKCEYVAEIKAQPLNQEFECVICSDDIKYDYIINYNCDCKDLICMECYKKLPPPKKCPLCRKTPYKLNLTIAHDEPPKRKFNIKYNNKHYDETIEINFLKRDETLIYFNIDELKICYFTFEIKKEDQK
jgi:hypothetical protein